MMNPFRTTFSIPVYDSKLTYKKPAVFIGSCFTETIGGRLKELKFPVDINPFGIIYNPVSVKNSLEMLVREKEFTLDDLYQLDDQWISFYHQTAFSDPDPEACLDTINSRLRFSSSFLRKADFLFIKVDPDGNEIWRSTFGHPDMIDYGVVLAPAAGGGYVAVGEQTPDHYTWEADIKWVKIDEDGNLVWERARSASHTMFSALLQHPDGGFVIAGGMSVGSMFNIVLIKTDHQGQVAE